MVGGINTFQYGKNNPINLFDKLGLRPLTEGERNALRYYFGASVNLDVIDLEGTDADRGNAIFGNDIVIPNILFKNGNDCEEVDLENPVAFSYLAHEVLHIWQKQDGRQVVLEAFFPQIGNFFGAHDPYAYDTSISDPTLLLNVFKSGGVEQQAQMIQDYIYLDQSNRISRLRGQPDRFDTSRYDKIIEHVFWRQGGK